ncbi:hypothetical protein [Bacillus infantis]|uniref:hypothetical protein n=1 Tax=Bacillus infantis TaxID=324767 RepID=UPI00209ED18D|nr:hypothetical protein [Bacillus infantis]MCP1156608.1 hypothetical protein [Bacillus infantis]
MKKTNKSYHEEFYAKKAVELNVKSTKEAKQIYEGLKHYARLTEKYRLNQVQHWHSVIQGISNSSIGSDK